jgi:hypothetical protein
MRGADDILWPEAFIGGEGEKQGFLRHQMIHHRSKEFGLSGDLADAAGIDPGKGDEALEPLVVAGEKGEGTHRNGLCGGPASFSRTQRHGLSFRKDLRLACALSVNVRQPSRAGPET